MSAHLMLVCRRGSSAALCVKLTGASELPRKLRLTGSWASVCFKPSFAKTRDVLKGKRARLPCFPKGDQPYGKSARPTLHSRPDCRTRRTQHTEDSGSGACACSLIRGDALDHGGELNGPQADPCLDTPHAGTGNNCCVNERHVHCCILLARPDVFLVVYFWHVLETNQTLSCCLFVGIVHHVVLFWLGFAPFCFAGDVAI